jgi:DMSO/TMAO reductase YedYZ molybdopterin-dependent catalytic subunit
MKEAKKMMDGSSNNKNGGQHDAQRRSLLKQGMSLGALAMAGGFPLGALAQGEELVPFTDVPSGFAPGPLRPNSTHILDTRQLDSFFPDDFYVVQHYGQPELDLDSYRLKVTGLVDNPLEFSLQQLMALPQVQRDIGFECGGNSNTIFHGLVGNARWGGASLRDILDAAGVQSVGREVVFFGADVGTEEIRGRQVEKAFARSMALDDAMAPANLLAYEMNGQPLPLHHGRPLRLVVPGWYGVANVKWLTQIHVQDTRYMGRFMGRDYVTLKREMVGGEERWVENSVARMNLKSVITRVTRRSGAHRISGFVFNDGTPLDRVEVSIDGGPWQRAEIDSQASQYSWKPFHFDWQNASAGEHTLVSRAIDVDGGVQISREEAPERVSRWEEFAQFPRTVMV